MLDTTVEEKLPLLLLSRFSRVRLLRPHRRQPTRLPRPWDSLGKNTGVGCHFLLQCMKVKSQSEVAQSCPTLRDPMDCSPPGSFVHGIFQARVLEWGAIAFSVLTIYCPITNHPKRSEAIIIPLRSRVPWVRIWTRQGRTVSAPDGGSGEVGRG